MAQSGLTGCARVAAPEFNTCKCNSTPDDESRQTSSSLRVPAHCLMVRVGRLDVTDSDDQSDENANADERQSILASVQLPRFYPLQIGCEEGDPHSIRGSLQSLSSQSAALRVPCSVDARRNRDAPVSLPTPVGDPRHDVQLPRAAQ